MISNLVYNISLNKPSWRNTKMFRLYFILWFFPIVKIKQLSGEGVFVKERWVWLRPYMIRDYTASNGIIKVEMRYEEEPKDQS